MRSENWVHEGKLPTLQVLVSTEAGIKRIGRIKEYYKMAIEPLRKELKKIQGRG